MLHLLVKKKIKLIIPYFLFEQIIYFFSKIKIFGTITHNVNSNLPNKLIINKGLFWKIFVVDKNSFFQERLENDFDNLNLPQIKPKIIRKAKQWIERNNVNLKKNKLAFVHIRRGDYNTFPEKKFAAVVNLKWYLNQIQLIKILFFKIDQKMILII